MRVDASYVYLASCSDRFYLQKVVQVLPVHIVVQIGVGLGTRGPSVPGILVI